MKKSILKIMEETEEILKAMMEEETQKPGKPLWGIIQDEQTHNRSLYESALRAESECYY